MGTASVSAMVTGLGSLSKGVFERRTSTRGGLFTFLSGGFAQIFSQIVSMRAKKLSNTNFISSRHVKRELKRIHRSKMSSVTTVFAKVSSAQFPRACSGCQARPFSQWHKWILSNTSADGTGTQCPSAQRGVCLFIFIINNYSTSARWLSSGIILLSKRPQKSRILPDFISKNNRFSACF